MNNVIRPSPKQQLIKDINHVCSWYQGRNPDICKKVERFVESLDSTEEEIVESNCINCKKPILHIGVCHSCFKTRYVDTW